MLWFEPIHKFDLVIFKRFFKPFKPPFVVFTLLVRNEEDVLEQNIEYHLGQGVDHIIATDNLSTDGTRDILERYRRDGVLSIITETDDDYSQSKWVTRMARMACDDFDADWVINSDADEFWFAGKENLKSFFGSISRGNIVIGRRSDMICVCDESSEDLPFYKRMKYKKKCSLNSQNKPLPPKVAHRADPGVNVSQGNHDVTFSSLQRSVCDQKLDILHYPIRSEKQFKQKIILGGSAYSNNVDLPKNVGSTWRSMYEELKKTGSIAYLAENTFSKSDLDEMVEAGLATLDLRLVQAMEKIYARG